MLCTADPPDVTSARETESDYISKWLKEIEMEERVNLKFKPVKLKTEESWKKSGIIL